MVLALTMASMIVSERRRLHSWTSPSASDYSSTPSSCDLHDAVDRRRAGTLVLVAAQYLLHNLDGRPASDQEARTTPIPQPAIP